MQLTETQEKKLCGVLDQLMSGYTINAEELSATHAYLFGAQPVAPFFTDKELFETVIYLRETVIDYELPDLDALLGYYENRKRQVHNFFQNAVAELDKKPLSCSEPERSLKVQIANSLSATTNALDTLAWQVTTEAGRLFEHLYAKALQLFESAPLPAAGEKSLHSAVRRHVRELVHMHRPIALECSLSVNTMLPCGIEHYVEQFASHYKGERIFIMHLADDLPGSVQKLEFEYRQLFSFNSGCLDWGNGIGDRPPDYLAIMEVIKRKEPIADYAFKLRLTEWLIYSRLIVSRRQCQENAEYPPIHVGHPVDRFFQDGAVRVYGGADMRYWIHNLYQEKLSRMKWVILKRIPGQYWLTSDNPGFLINLRELRGDFTEVVPKHSLLDMGPDSLLYYPLSKEYCLKIEPRVEARGDDPTDYSIQYDNPYEGELDFVNGVTLSTSKKVIITSQRKALQQI